MQSFDQSLKSPTKRLGVSLNVDTGYKGKAKENSPPVTPPQQMRTNTAGRGNNAAANRALRRNGPRETFLDDITPIDGSMVRENEDRNTAFRDSHDLSLHPRQVTRDSLVDNMLLSLDQFSFDRDVDRTTPDDHRLYAPFNDENPYIHSQNFAPRNGRSLSHSYSYSSDYDNADDGSRYSGQINRSRRSNSSSNFQSGLGRINSLRNDSGVNPGFVTKPGSRGPPIQIPPRGLHSRSGKGSKGSSANSLDLGYQSPSTQRWGHGLGGRSSSFDFGSDKQSAHPPANIMNRQLNTSASYAPYGYDAAPTPTVPGGPSRPRPASPVYASQPDSTSTDAVPPRIERRRSTKSAKSGYRANNTGSTSTAGRPDYGLHDDARELPPMPAFVKETSPAPAPHVGYEKSKQATPAPKERPGFFRRLFGSSSGSHLASTPDPPRSHGSSISPETGDRPNSKSKHIASQMRSQQTAPSREAPPVPQPTLTKKPSSFFRRRKKSISETEAPVPVPALPRVDLTPEKEPSSTAKPQPSPVSSLRQVMNPYIRTPQRSPLPVLGYDGIDREMNNSPEPYPRATRGFSPDYDPDQSATIRPVNPPSRDAPSRENNDRNPSSHSTDQNGLLKSVTPGQNKHSRDEQDATFLQDASDNDQDTVSTKSKTLPATIDFVDNKSVPETRSTSPSVARDMALVAEYERKHSKRSPNVAKQDPPTLKHKPSPIDTTRGRSNLKATTEDEDEKEYIVITPTKIPPPAKPDERVWLEPSSSEDEVVVSTLTVPPQPSNASQLTSSSTDTVYKSAMSTALPIVQIEGQDAPEEDEENRSVPRLMTASEAIKALDELVAKEEAKQPSNADRERAQQLYDGLEDLVTKDKAAAWLGEDGTARAKTLLAYMELYDFSNINILAALRVMCGRLVLRAESQQVDRILDAFAKRWCECNPNHGFKIIDVVHTICYSLLLLNTDLHMADIDQKMTRSQFVKNTMHTIRKSVNECAPDAFEPARPSVLPGKGSAFDNAKNESTTHLDKTSLDLERPSWRSSFRPPPRADANGNNPTALDFDTPTDDCGPLVKAPFHGTLRTWEVQIEVVLKDFYNSIRADRLPLFGAPLEKPQTQPTNTLSVFTNGVLRRSPSVLSKTPSEAQSYGARGRTADSVRTANGKWATKNRSRPRLYPGSSGLGSSRTSLDDQSSIWSPSVSSSTWSKYSLGKTHTSMSVDSLGSSYPQGDYQSSIGFANALSQAIIREEHVGTSGSGGSDREELRVAPLLEDESLELHGAPWAKEGIVKHKHHLEAMDRKAKNRDWNEVFAVIEKGYMSLFSFSSKSMKKSRGKAVGGVVGGGNWQENAESLGSFLLRQTIASALPSPGYSKTRPHVWALSLPTGAVHLFQVGTADIIKEFVTTANYWSARLSNHPLVGGISNIEYGWSDSIVNNALVTSINESTTRPRASSSGHRPSLQSSLRSSLDQGMNGAIRSRLPGDKITISDWSPPTQSMRASNLMEPDQLSTLRAYVAGIEDELQKHNQLRSPMLLAFTPRHPNAQKAMANWEKKSSYLLREIVKFRTYIDSLQAADTRKQEIYVERAERRRMMMRGSDDEDDADVTLRA